MKMFKIVTVIFTGLALAGYVFAAEHPTAETKAAEGAGVLDGQVFVGEMVKAGEESGDPDTLIFKGDTFVSTACTAYGFNKTAYKAHEEGGVITFTAQPVNEAKETLTWNGTIKDGKVKATAVLQTKSGQTEYTYTGTLKPADSKPSEHPKTSDHPKSEHPK